jgi:hypothetical protein
MLEERGLGETRSFTPPVPLKDAGLEETRRRIAGARKMRKRGNPVTHRKARLEVGETGKPGASMEAALKDGEREETR